MGRNIARSSEIMLDNNTNTTDPNVRRKILYGSPIKKNLLKNELGYISHFKIWARVYSLACITTGYGINLKTECLKATTHPHKISFE